MAMLLFQATPALAATDSDGDGISDSVETSGWSNKSGGPYHTSPTDSDSDNDGLSDGEEQLFGTNPLSNASPGIYARYSNAFRTQKYYSWIKYGTKYSAHGEDQYRTVLVRRGTSLVVGGRPGATLSVLKSTSTLTTLSVHQNSSGNSWNVTIPSSGTVGKYTLKLSSGSWSKTLNLYVIFEIPSNLATASAAAYVYADDLADNRDNYSVWFITNQNSNSKLSTSYNYNAYATAFVLDRFKQYIFEGYVINTINGKTNPNDAFVALAHKVDQVTRIDFNVWKTTMWDALHSSQQRNDCARIADIAVGFLRSAGIASRAIVTDWKTMTFDTSIEAWIGSQWLTVRAWKSSSETNISNSIVSGIYGPYTQYYFGHNKYMAKDNAVISTMGPNWQWKEVRDGSHCGSKAQYVYNNWYLPELGKESPPDSPGGIDRAAGWLPLTKPYWGWPSEPSTSHTLSYLCGAQVTDLTLPPAKDQRLEVSQAGAKHRSIPLNGSFYVWFLPLLLGLLAFLRARSQRRALWGGACAALALMGIAAALLLNSSLLTYSQEQSPSQQARVSKVLSDYGIDTDGNGRFDALVVEVQVDVKQPGSYTVIGHLSDTTPTPQTADGYLATASTYVPLAAGKQVVKLQFNGETIYQNGEDGSYSLDDLWLTDQESPEESELKLLDSQQPGYHTAAYSRNSFENGGAKLSGSYTHAGLDTNQDGFLDQLTVNTGVEINTPGLYYVEGELADAQGKLVATAAWSGSDGQVSLSFQALLGDITSYYLRAISLYNAQGELIDSAPEAESDSPSVYATGPLYNLGLGEVDPQYASPRVTSAKAKDVPGAVDFHGFDVVVNTGIAVEGDYRLEAWLEGSDGEPFAWETGDPVHLTPGLRDLSLSFKDRKIKLFKAKAPYKLVALKLLYGSGYIVVSQLDVAL